MRELLRAYRVDARDLELFVSASAKEAARSFELGVMIAGVPFLVFTTTVVGDRKWVLLGLLLLILVLCVWRYLHAQRHRAEAFEALRKHPVAIVSPDSEGAVLPEAE